MERPTTFDELLDEGQAEPVEGWDFSWFEGRATEERPSWGYASKLVPRVASAGSVLDIQTGGGETLAAVLAQIPRPPGIVQATESWGPNASLARRRLASSGVTVVEVPDAADLPFDADRFELVISRHPTVTVWQEIARVLRPGGVFLSQQVGAGSNRELTDFMMGPQPVSGLRSTTRAVAQAEAAGLDVVDLRHESLRTTFDDVGANGS